MAFSTCQMKKPIKPNKSAKAIIKDKVFPGSNIKHNKEVAARAAPIFIILRLEYGWAKSHLAWLFIELLVL